ncbi:hypothetical protein BZL30_8451 [Mycobacterium kansasii]|uniref:Uncharacterized protein n=1 Tax=Mycobacterium kansasii TaxID=1768 RepID=A0A1V3WIH0_MYCKA|nr:hypothetical protein BZL30_8451 [Mycobacterium kansasii]
MGRHCADTDLGATGDDVAQPATAPRSTSVTDLPGVLVNAGTRVCPPASTTAPTELSIRTASPTVVGR